MAHIMSYLSLNDYYKSVAAGEIPGDAIIDKFGRASVGTTYAPVCFGAVYNMLQPAAATTLRVKIGNVNDTAAGTGARSITIEGINASGALVTDTLATAGATASAVTSNSYIRMTRFWVATSGTYVTPTTGSHSGDIVIENGAGGTDWGTIPVADFPRGQSEIAMYTVPNGKVVYLLGVSMTTDSTKTCDFLFLKRESCLDAAAPYEAARMVLDFTGVVEPVERNFPAPIGPFPANTDLGWLAKVSATTSILEARMQLLERDV